jgi:hypothetical protein
MRYIEDPTPRLVMRRAARENLYAPEYTEKFQNYVMNLWARDCYAPKDSRDDLVALIRACPTDPQNACKFAAQYNWKEYTNTELEFAIEIVERVVDGDTGYVDRLLKAMRLCFPNRKMKLARKPKKNKKTSACEVAANLYMELVQAGKRPATRHRFCLLLEDRLKSLGLLEVKAKATSLRSILQTIGLYDAWRPRTKS